MKLKILIVLLFLIGPNNLSQSIGQSIGIPDTNLNKLLLQNIIEISKETPPKVLTSVTFRNGDSLRFITNIEEWRETYTKTSQPACFIKNNEILYNWSAINDERKLTPLGFKIPNIGDGLMHLLPKNKLPSSKKNEILENYLCKNESHDEHYLSTTGHIPSLNLNKNHSVWLKGDYSEVYGIYYSENAHENGTIIFCDNGKLKLSTAIKSDGYPTVCIADEFELLQIKNYSYSELLPLTFEDFKSNLRNYISKSTNLSVLKNGSHATLSGSLIFSSNGTNISSPFYFENKTSASQTEKNIKEITNEFVPKWKVYPSFQNKAIATKEEISISININYVSRNSIDKWSLDFTALNLYQSAQIKGILDTKNSEIHPKIGLTKLEISINSDSALTYYQLRSFSVPSNANGLFSIIPGMGRMIVNGKGKIPYLLAGVVLGSVAVASKYNSNAYYKKYAISDYSDNVLYDKANNLNKIFICSAIIYGGLTINDFLYAIKKISKAQKIMKNINKQILYEYPTIHATKIEKQ